MTHFFRNANTAVDTNTKSDMKQDVPAVLIDGNIKSSYLTILSIIYYDLS